MLLNPDFSTCLVILVLHEVEKGGEERGNLKMGVRLWKQSRSFEYNLRGVFSIYKMTYQTIHSISHSVLTILHFLANVGVSNSYGTKLSQSDSTA